MNVLRRLFAQLDPDLQPAVVALALVLGTTAGLAFSTVA
jgi:hypothetical protein